MALVKIGNTRNMGIRCPVQNKLDSRAGRVYGIERRLNYSWFSLVERLSHESDNAIARVACFVIDNAFFLSPAFSLTRKRKLHDDKPRNEETRRKGDSKGSWTKTRGFTTNFHGEDSRGKLRASWRQRHRQFLFQRPRRSPDWPMKGAEVSVCAQGSIKRVAAEASPG